MKLRPIALFVMVALLGALALGAPNVALSSTRSTHSPSPAQGPFTDIPVTGDCSNNGVPGAFVGTLSVSEFAYQNGVLNALGTLNGTCTAAGDVSTVTNEPVTTQASPGTHTCRILRLDLGPLHLALLGLVIDLAPVHLTIKAISGPGRLLGNLLCLIAHLLDGVGPPPLPIVAPLMNAVVATLE